jgi:hypothetical protein
MPGWLEILLNAFIVVVFTTMMASRELERQNRSFPWWPIARSRSFVLLVLLQSTIVFGFLLALVHTGRATFTSYVDAVWVSLAGLSLLKALPAPKGEDAQRLWGLADWIFAKFYRSLRAEIYGQRELFKEYLRQRYAGDAARLWSDVKEFIGFEGKDEELLKQGQALDALQSPQEKVQYLVDYIGPQTTKDEWIKLKGKE